ncbi:hypothetical protein ACJOV8_009030 [Formosa sp. 3Alg 14/1]|uniref:hypothetical protein n=1 Tax=Formosa sp. 3Alg 14/1 TaxID=3382190 RepID=UPI0039BDBD97
MNLKWYLSTLTVIVAVFFGVASQHSKAVPNQEIVLQLSGYVSAQENADKAISTITEQLQSIGAENIQVSEGEHGVLNITYYSDSDVDRIKKILSEDQSLAFDNSTSKHKQLPSEDGGMQTTYNFDVFEIHNGYDFAFEHSGKVAVELKASSHHFNNSNDYPRTTYSSDVVKLPSIKVAYKFYRTIALAIDNDAKKIPEVRAGPIT